MTFQFTVHSSAYMKGEDFLLCFALNFNNNGLSVWWFVQPETVFAILQIGDLGIHDTWSTHNAGTRHLWPSPQAKGTCVTWSSRQNGKHSSESKALQLESPHHLPQQWLSYSSYLSICGSAVNFSLTGKRKNNTQI